MMTAARFRYKKRTPTQTVKPGKRRARSNSSVAISPTSSHCHLNTSVQGSGNSLVVPGTLRRRSGSVPAIKLNTLASAWSLKYEQVRALRMTWARLCEPPRSHCRGIVNLVERVWEKLDAKDSSVRNIFYNAAFVDSMQERCERRRSKCSISTLRDHTHFFVSLVSQVIQSLDVEPEEILEHMDTIGRNHAYLKKYGFKSSHWEKVGEYFIDIVVIQDCVRGFPEACRAWTILIAAIVDRLRAAPRRGSTVCSPVNSAHGSSQSINETRRGSCSALIVNTNNGNGNHLGCPMSRIPGHHASTSDLTRLEATKKLQNPRPLDSVSSCIDLSPLAKNLPNLRHENSAFA